MNEPPSKPTEPSTNRRISPKAIASVAGAVLAGLVLAVVLLNLPRGETGEASGSASPSASASASASASDEPSTPPTASAQPTPTPPLTGAAPMTWTAGTPPDGLVNDIVRVADHWLAAGWIVEGENRPRAATWTSVDGIAWEAGAQIGPDPVPGPEGMSFRIDDVLVLADELIAFGWNHVGCCDGGQAALWRSTDGVNWTFVDATGTDYGETYHFPIDAAVAPTGELVLVSAIGLGGGSTVFTSSDGITWVEQPVDGEGTFIGSVAASDTTLLAVGQGANLEEPIEVVWISSDGHSWSPVDPPAGSGDLYEVAWDAASGQFVIVGSSADGLPTAWLTEDGTSWGTTTLADVDGVAASVSAADGLIVASGTTGTSPDAELIAWSSFDGVTWQVMSIESSTGASPIVETADESAVLYTTAVGPEPDYETIAKTWAGTLIR